VKIIDLFAGCGGLSMGFENAGFEPIYVNELNKDALDSYIRNRVKKFPSLKKFNSNDIKGLIGNNQLPLLLNSLSDFHNIDFKSENIDIIAGGPPCQGFSGIGHRRSYNVDKAQLPSNHLYQDMAYFIHKFQPKGFVFENVEGLLRSRWTKSGNKGEIFKDVFNTFKSIKGYTVKYRLVKAKDYGVPQNRPRVIIIGVKRKYFKDNNNGSDDALKCGLLPEPKNDYPDLKDVLSDLIDPNYSNGVFTEFYPSNPNCNWQKQIRKKPNSSSYFKKGDNLTEQEYSKHNKIVIERFTSMIENEGKIPEHLKTKKFAQRLLPKSWNESGPNITACSLADDFVHFEQPRTLTVREWARLQTFPDWYEFSGKRTTGGIRRAGNPLMSIYERELPKYTQIGNAVPVKLAFEIGNHLKSIIG
tara:strand:+ start:316 stop:1560 length:1245 start_codon:yes stop_codon:yes gene_type:complete